MPIKKFNNKLENCNCELISSSVKEPINKLSKNHAIKILM